MEGLSCKTRATATNNLGIVCFTPSVHFSDFFYVNNRLWFEIYGNSDIKHSYTDFMFFLLIN